MSIANPSLADRTAPSPTDPSYKCIGAVLSRNRIDNCTNTLI